ncbi:MalY/PatB family protein [Lacrimispora sp. BS-2]|uniref:cysteine-S-conjugate beta-lyase n=1 Tax=Lacrimispora sp. BS-2 TaxID=3151850 RepID=A0AAU7PV36_9FIRM
MRNSFDEGVDRHGTACIKWDFQETDYGMSGLLPFSIADGDYPTYTPILYALKKRIDNGVIGYTDLNEEYYSAVSGWCQRRHDWKIKHSWIVPTGGIVPAICNALEALTEKDAKVIIQPPIYDPFYSIIQASGRQLIKNDLILDENGYRMDYDGLEAACKAGGKVIILCSPHNPVCRVWKKEELKRLVDISKKYGVIIISDEIHWDLILGDHVHTTMGKFEEIQDRLIVCTSCSKTFNIAGLETSNLIIPGKELREKYQHWLYARYLFCPNTLGLEATRAAYADGDEWVDEEREYLTQNAEAVCKFMKDFLPKVRVTKPEGTYLLWFDMRAYQLSSEELVKRIAKAGAGLNNGHHYGEKYDGFVRMNIACPRKQLMAGLECIKLALNDIG